MSVFWVACAVIAGMAIVIVGIVDSEWLVVAVGFALVPVAMALSLFHWRWSSRREHPDYRD